MLNYLKKKNIKIGILGGTFDPAHKGHLVISRIAKKKIKLNYIIWSITRKNPFKKQSKIDVEERIKISKKITKKDWETEYLSPTISVKGVDGVEEAIDHINKYGSSHTDSIVTKNKKTAKKFLSNIKSSIAIHNASTQFADGGEFGFGAEVGISTTQLHPRGPIGINQLTTYKYILEGKGQI